MTDTTVTTAAPGQVASATDGIVNPPVVKTEPTTTAAAATTTTEPAKVAEPAAKTTALTEPPTSFDVAALKLPDGFVKDEAMMGKFKETFDGLKGLPPQEAAQKLTDFYTDALKAVGEANTKNWENVNKGWVDSIKADPEVGGEKLEPTRQSIAKAIDSLGPELAKGFREALDVTGAGNHPGMIKAMAKFAALANEGSHVPGQPPSSKSTVEWFPNSPEMK